MTTTCNEARSSIISARFLGWTGLPSGCTSEALFGVALDSTWGELRLGQHSIPTSSRLLDLPGYYRPLAFSRNGVVVLFDGTNPSLSTGWGDLSADLGRPSATLDWVHGTIAMRAGELVYAKRGIAVCLNPENLFVIHVSLFVPTTLEDYVNHLRIDRRKKALPKGSM